MFLFTYKIKSYNKLNLLLFSNNKIFYCLGWSTVKLLNAVPTTPIVASACGT
jgi:hypothetical protein